MELLVEGTKRNRLLFGILVFILGPSPDVISDMVVETGIIVRAVCLEDYGVNFRKSNYGGDDMDCSQGCEEVCKLGGYALAHGCMRMEG